MLKKVFIQTIALSALLLTTSCDSWLELRPQDGIVQDRFWNNKDISGFVPNLYSADPGDNRDVVSIRGIATTSYDPAVATYIDGVNQFNLDTYIPA